MRLRSHLSLALCGSIALAAGLFFGASWWITGRIVDTSLDRRLADQVSRLENEITAEAARGRAMLQLVTSLPPVVEAFAEGDRNRLSALLVPTFQILKNEGVEQFQFHTAPATSFLRVHQPAKFGDDLSAFRRTVVEANRGKTLIQGLEGGVFGIGIRSVGPVQQGGRHIGTAEFGLTFGEQFARTFSERTGASVGVFIRRDNGFVRHASSFRTDHAPQADLLAGAMREPVTVRSAAIGTSSLALRYSALKDYSGAAIGVVAIGIDRSEFDTMWRETLWLFAGISLAVLALGIFLTWRLDVAVARPLGQLTHCMNSLVAGGVCADMPKQVRIGEIADLLRAVTVFRDTTEERSRLEAANAREVEARQLQNRTFDQAVETFRTSAGQVLDAVAATASRLRGTAEGLAGTAAEAADQAKSAAEASDETSGNVQTVAAASEQLSGSIEEIARQIGGATDVIERAGLITERSAQEIEMLAQASQRIGDVVGLIQAVAGQTNLLALNATIEAARAGEAGRGFAVVASEVKALAAQTARATQEISEQISAIQSSTSNAVESIREVAQAMTEIRAVTGTISVAVEQQSAATREISLSAQQAATGTNHLAGNVAGVTRAIGETHRSSEEVLSASSALTTESGRLAQEITTFLQVLRTGPLDRRRTRDPNFKGPERRQRG